ncbi:MAG: DUF349 domain-containing protein [Pseudomonadales bacterium]|nr:DUF349 domain-containing protein [Pseudomonadales bacterium]
MAAESSKQDAQIAASTSEQAADTDIQPDSAATPAAAESVDPGSTPAVPEADGEQPEQSAEKTVKQKPAPKKPDDLDLSKELAGLQTELEKLSPKNTTRLVTIENNLNRFRKFIGEQEQELMTSAETIRESLQQKFAVNAEHQVSLKEQTLALIQQLEVALGEGKSIDALPTWDKIQGNISNTNGSIRQELQGLTQAFKTKINELRDWKIFAATEKKKELIQQMDKLKESRMQPGDKSKHISRLHKEWKELGRSNQNEELWQQFKLSSDAAYEPCKEYFKQRKQLMASNLKARRELCDELEVLAKSYGEQEPATSELNKQLKLAEEKWKKYAPVEQSRIKPLQKRYYAALNQLRKLRRDKLKSSAKLKSDIVERARGLLSLDDRKQAMSEAKRLQQEWKQAGQSTYKEDKEYWEKFRSICDEIFAGRDKQQTERKANIEQAQKTIDELLDSLEKISTLDDDELRSSKSRYQDIQQSFASALDKIHGKFRNKYRDRFNNYKRKLDTRIKSLPDKKSQLLLNIIHRCLEYLRPLETKVLASETPDLETVQNSFDSEHWKSLAENNGSEYISLLQQRAQLLCSAKDISHYQSAANDASEQLKLLCIEAEIRAGAESPEADQATRMEIQLSQLKQGFGQRQQDRDGNVKFMQQSRMKCLCLGPVSQQQQQVFSERLEKSLQRLV